MQYNLCFCRYKLNEKVKYKKSLLMKIDDSERKLQRMSSEKVQSAMEEFGGVVCCGDKLFYLGGMASLANVNLPTIATYVLQHIN